MGRCKTLSSVYPLRLCGGRARGFAVGVYTGVKRVAVGGVGLLEPILQSLKRPAQPARWVKSTTEGWIAIERPGYHFDRVAAKRAYLDAMGAGQREFRLPVTYIGQFPTADDFYNLGIREQLAEGQTNFSARSTTVYTTFASPPAASKWGQVKPSQGEISLRTGFQEAFVIIGDKTEIGVDQVGYYRPQNPAILVYPAALEPLIT